MTATKPGRTAGTGKPIRVFLTPQHVAAFTLWLDEVGWFSTAQVIRDHDEHNHAAAVALRALSTAIIAEGSA
jgi:hypothetical protein